MANRIAGSNRKLTIEGVSYEIAADANFSEMISSFENSMIPTSGSNMRKMIKRVNTVEGVVLVTDADERIALKSVADSIDDVKLSYTNAAGDTYKATGAIEVETNETEENRTNCILLPRGDWTPFVA
jgi:hypothetical protein